MLALALASGLACACSSSSPDTSAPGSFPAAVLVSSMSAGGTLRVDVRTSPDQPPSRGTSSVELTLTDVRGAPVDGLTLTVVPWMPAMGHGTAVPPVVTPAGNGRYVLTNVNMFMPGEWDLRTTFEGSVSDHAAPALQIP